MHPNTTFTFDQVKRATGLVVQRVIAIQDALAIVRKEDNEKADEKMRAYEALHNLDITKMSKQEIIDATWKLPELPKEVYYLLEEQGGFKTGSSMFTDIENPNDEDWCVCIPPSVFDGWTLGQSDHGYWEADGFSTVYTHYKGQLLNIICFSDTRLFYAWQATTQAMIHMGNMLPTERDFREPINFADLFRTKWKRVILFRAFKDICYDPISKKPMDKVDAIKYHKCCECSREAIYFTCKAARTHYEETAVCERCAGITY